MWRLWRCCCLRVYYELHCHRSTRHHHHHRIPVFVHHSRCSYSILDEEDDIIAAHRQQIEDSMEMVQREMVLLQTVEQPGGSVDA